MTCFVYSCDPCMDDERWSCGAKIWLELDTMIGFEDNVANTTSTIAVTYYL